METRVIQFGTSRFLKAHADLFVSGALGRWCSAADLGAKIAAGAVAEEAGRV